jgi:C-terminal processing protease CtpA/Prc
VIGWWHHGWGGSPAGRAYHEHRVVAPIEAPGDSILPVGSEVSVAIGRGLWCSVPLTVYADSNGTLPRSPGPGSAASGPLVPLRPEGWIPSGRDRATRLAGVMLFWNVAQHFYPYFDVIGTDWPARLPAALRAAAEDGDHEAYAATLERLVSALHDGHGRVSGPTSGGWSVPLAWRFAENRLVVDAVDTLRSGRVRPGDEVIAIDGRPIAACIRDAEARVSGATPQYVRARVAARLATIEGADSVALDLRSRAGATWRQRMVRDSSGWVRAARRDSVAELRPGLLYIDLRRVTDQDFQRELPRLAEARGVIFDLRGYPGRISPVVLAHLIDTTITSARWNIPIVRHPDHRDLEFEFSNWPVPPRSPRIRARAAFLIDAKAISYAETFLGMVEHYRLAELVGEATAGTNGNIVMQRLPGGYSVVFTGMKVLKHDGSRHHGVGILPTVPVSPTIAGISAGRDEQLEKAIEVVSR